MMSTSNMPRVYLDNAATSWPKPEAVYAVVDDYQRNIGAPTGRSGYTEAAYVTREVETARRHVARLLGVRNPAQLVFGLNGTDAINLAIHGSLGSGDHVVTSVVEHNSVLRPLDALERSGKIKVTRVECDSQGVVDPGVIRSALRPETALIALAHASNVTGALQPIEAVGEIARARRSAVSGRRRADLRTFAASGRRIAGRSVGGFRPQGAAWTAGDRFAVCSRRGRAASKRRAPRRHWDV